MKQAKTTTNFILKCFFRLSAPSCVYFSELMKLKLKIRLFIYRKKVTHGESKR